MFSPAQTNALSPKIEGDLCIFGGFRIGAHAKPPSFISPFHNVAKRPRHFWLDGVNRAGINIASGPIDSDHITFYKHLILNKNLTAYFIKSHITRTAHTGPAHTTCHHRGMACHTAACGQNASRRMHAVDIFWACFQPYQNDCLARRRHFFGAVRTQYNLAAGRPRGRRQAACQTGFFCFRIKCWVKQLVKRIGINPA